MPDDLTPAVSRALQEAHLHARAEGAAHVLPAHLARGLLAEAEGRAATLCAAAGLDLAAYHRASPGPRSASAGTPTSELPLAPAVLSALEGARDLARELNGEST